MCRKCRLPRRRIDAGGKTACRFVVEARRFSGSGNPPPTSQSVRGPAMSIVPIRDAVTAVLCHAGDIFLVRRQISLTAFPGYHAFPGGKVDEADGFGEAGPSAIAVDIEPRVVARARPRTEGGAGLQSRRGLRHRRCRILHRPCHGRDAEFRAATLPRAFLSDRSAAASGFSGSIPAKSIQAAGRAPVNG